MSYNTFPALAGLGWDIKKRPMFSTAKEISASGARFHTARWPIPHYEFDLAFNYLSQADRDALEAFYNGQSGAAFPFLLSVTNDNAQTAKACSGTADGTNKIFQMPLPAQAQVVTSALFDNGSAAGAATVSASGLITFTTAPLAGHAITWTGTYAYLVNFKDDTEEFNQMMSQMYEVQQITMETYR